MKRLLVSMALLVGVVSPVSAQDLSGVSFARAIREQAQAAAPAPQQQRTGMSPALKWTGIGLLAGGGVHLALGAATDSDDRTCAEGSCFSTRTLHFGLGATLAGVGALLLAIGAHEAGGPAPTIAFVPRGVMLQKSIPLTRAPSRRR